MAEHVCKCEECHPQYFPSGPRQGLNHIGLRFPDTTYAEKKACPYLNGKPVPYATECLVGTEGWVRRYGEDHSHKCKCGHGVCEEILHGNVTVEMDDVGRGIEDRMYYMEAHRDGFQRLEEDAEYRSLGLALRLKRFQKCPVCDRYCQSKDRPGEAATLFMCDCGWFDWVKDSEWANALSRDDVYVRMAMDAFQAERKRVKPCP